jgi:hypothetical protein
MIIILNYHTGFESSALPVVRVGRWSRPGVGYFPADGVGFEERVGVLSKKEMPGVLRFGKRSAYFQSKKAVPGKQKILEKKSKYDN